MRWTVSTQGPGLPEQGRGSATRQPRACLQAGGGTAPLRTLPAQSPAIAGKDRRAGSRQSAPLQLHWCSAQPRSGLQPARLCPALPTPSQLALSQWCAHAGGPCVLVAVRGLAYSGQVSTTGSQWVGSAAPGCSAHLQLQRPPAAGRSAPGAPAPQPGGLAANIVSSAPGWLRLWCAAAALPRTATSACTPSIPQGLKPRRGNPKRCGSVTPHASLVTCCATTTPCLPRASLMVGAGSCSGSQPRSLESALLLCSA